MSFVPLPNLVYSRTYRFAEEHIRKLAHLSAISNKEQSEIVREALDEYYERHIRFAPGAPQRQEPQS